MYRYAKMFLIEEMNQDAKAKRIFLSGQKELGVKNLMLKTIHLKLFRTT